MYSGPKIVQENLIFGYDTGRNPSSAFDERFQKRRHFRGKPMTNFFPDGHFPNGNHMASQAGSNAQNDVVLLKNPGDSPYVLRQSMGVAYTEYQINLTTELSASTTYCMSGWYAESSNYSGSSRMFHARAHSSSGAHISTGAGVYNVIKTKRVGGLLWKFAFYTITTPSDYNNNFNWYLGYLNQSYTGYRYYTNIKLEQGTRPSPYHAGQRTSTNSLIDLKKSKTLDLANVSFDSDGLVDFDGSNDTIDMGGFDIQNRDYSVEVVYDTDNPTLGQGIITDYQYSWWMMWLDSSNKLNWRHKKTDANTFLLQSPSSVGDGYHHIVFAFKLGTGAKMYIDGVLVASNTFTDGFGLASPRGPRYVGHLRTGAPGSPSSYFNGKIPVVKIYQKTLSSNEVKQNFSAYRRRFNI